MGINYKYFVTAIVAIFLALGIGILIGFMLDGENFVKDQQTKTIKQVEQKFNKLTTINSNLTKEKGELNEKIKKYSKFASMVSGELLKGKLSGMNIAVIETTDDYIYNNHFKSLEKAGANIASYMVVKSSMLKDNAILKIKLKDYLKSKKIEVKASKAYEEFFKIFASAVYNGNNKDIIDFAKGIGLIQVNKYSNAPVDSVIIAGGALSEDDAETENLDKYLIDQLKDENAKVVGVQNSTTAYSYIYAYKKQGISTIDNVDSPIGLIALAMILQGRTGNFGEGLGATNLLPESFIEDYKVVHRVMPKQQENTKSQSSGNPAIN